MERNLRKRNLRQPIKSSQLPDSNQILRMAHDQHDACFPAGLLAF